MDNVNTHLIRQQEDAGAMSPAGLDGLEADVMRVVRFRIHRDGVVINRLPLWSGYRRQPKRRVLRDDLAAFLEDAGLRAKYFDGLTPLHAAIIKFSKLRDCALSARQKLEAELCRYFPPSRRHWWEFWKL